MDKEIIDRIQDLKTEIRKSRDNIQEITELVKKEIDREFPIDLWELSDKELDAVMGERLSIINERIDTRPVSSDIHSHRGLSGKIIVRFKRFLLKISSVYTNMLFDKQRELNGHMVFFQLASFIRQKRLEEKIKEINRTVKEIKEDQFFQIQTTENNQTTGTKKDPDAPAG